MSAKVYITFHDDRTVDRVFNTWQSAADRLVVQWHESRGGGSSPIAPWDREQMERLARDHIGEEAVWP